MCFQSPRAISYGCIVLVSFCICFSMLRLVADGFNASDLHTFRGVEPTNEGVIMGHEVTGEIVETGEGVKSVQKGDVVVSAFTTSW